MPHTHNYKWVIRAACTSPYGATANLLSLDHSCSTWRKNNPKRSSWFLLRLTCLQKASLEHYIMPLFVHSCVLVSSFKHSILRFGVLSLPFCRFMGRKICPSLHNWPACCAKTAESTPIRKGNHEKGYKRSHEDSFQKKIDNAQIEGEN